MELSNNIWRFRYSNGMPVGPTRRRNGDGFRFTFPLVPNDVDYLTTAYRGDAQDYVSATAKIARIDGTPVFVASGEGEVACHARFLVEREGDDLSDEDGRWWSRLRSFPLRVGEGWSTVTVPFHPVEWSNVHGKVASERRAQFRVCLDNVGHVGLTFGATFFGHGVSVKGGRARMVVSDFEVE